MKIESFYDSTKLESAPNNLTSHRVYGIYAKYKEFIHRFEAEDAREQCTEERNVVLS